MAPHATDNTINDAGEAQAATAKASTSNQALPVSDPCLSFWHRTTRGWAFLNHNENSPVPTTVKYVIIGSGLSGTRTAWSLVEEGISPPDILILEAREGVSGASGRNAGHVRPDAFRGCAAYARVHGHEQARKIIENEKLVFEQLDAFIKAHNVACDFNPTTTFDVCLTEEFARYEAESLELYKAAGGDTSHVRYFEGSDAKARTRVADAVAAYEWPAGSSHPAKLTQWMLSKLIERGLQLWTHCPAVAVEKHSASSPKDCCRWDVRTPRGVVAAEAIVHCTNAYAGYLLPELSSFITPNRAQAASFIPGKALSGSNALNSTMSLRYDLRHYFSFIQRGGDGTVIFGVSRGNPHWSSATKDSIVTFDDRSYNEEIAATVDRALHTLFPSQRAQVRRAGEEEGYHWSGIIAMTADSVPLVGAIEGKEGQFICAGHNGHGMARIWTCASGLAKLMVGAEWVSTGLPECFQYSGARLERAAQQSVQANSVW